MNPTSPARLILVDDDPGVREGIGHMLHARGYNVDLAASGPEALEKLQQATYNLMLLDMRLPGLNGLEVMRQAQELQTGLAIIVLTAHPSLENAIGSLRSGSVVDYLRKPASWHEIEQAVARALERQAKIRRRQQEDALLASLRQTVRGRPAQESPSAAAADHLVWPPLTLQRAKQLVHIEASAARVVYLTPGETAVLAAMMADPEQVHTCAALARLALDYELTEAEARPVIRPYIFRLRRKIELKPARPRLIVTVRGQGYALGRPGPNRPAAFSQNRP